MSKLYHIPNPLSMGNKDYGIEPESIAQLMKSDFGREPDIWQRLDKGLSDRIAQVQGTQPPPSQQPTQVNDAVPRPSPLLNRIKLGPPKSPLDKIKSHPLVQAATQRLTNHGIRVEDKMPDHYSPEMRAQAIHNVANGVDFMHQQFPGMSDLAKKHSMKYTLQGPQVLGGGQLMGQYHSPLSQENQENAPKIELNGTAENTLWHEQAHFLDHAAAGLEPRQRGTITVNHPLQHFAQELQYHPVRQMARKAEVEAALQSGDMGQVNHALYRNEPDEVMARWFNSHMNYLHQKQHGRNKTSEPYDSEENEGWTPEHHEHFGPKFREILRQHQLIKSMTYILVKAGEGVGSWSGSGEFQHTPTTPTPKPKPAFPTGEGLVRGEEAENHPLVQTAKNRLTQQGITVEDKMPYTYNQKARARIINSVANGVEVMHNQFPGLKNLAEEHGLKYTLQGPQAKMGGELHGMYHGNEDTPRIEINNTGEQTLWHEHAHWLDHASADYEGMGTRTPGHGLRDFVKELQAHPVYKTRLQSEMSVPKKSQAPGYQKNLSYRHQPEEVFARFFNSHMDYLNKKHGTSPTMEGYDKDYNEPWSEENHEHFGPRLRDVFKKYELTSSFGEYLDTLNKALEETTQSTPPININTTVPATTKPQLERNPRGYLMKQGYNVENRMPRQSYSDDEQQETMRKTAKALDHVNTVLPGFHDLANKHNMTISFKGADLQKGRPLMGRFHGEIKDHARITMHDSSRHTLWHELGHFIDHAATNRESYATEDPNEENAHPLALLTDSLMNTPEHRHFMDNTTRVWQGPQPFPGFSTKTMHDPVEHSYLKQPSEVFARFFNAHMNHLHNKLNTDTQNQEPLEDEEEWTPETLEKHGAMLHDILRKSSMTKSFAEYLDSLSKALEETRQTKPLRGTTRAARMPSGYKIPKKVTRPGVRGSTLWWIAPNGEVRYGPKPVQKGPPKDEPQHIKNYLESESPWSFMSAYSDSKPPDQNDQAHAQLGKQLRDKGYQVYPSKGYYSDEQGQLREESSYLVIGLDSKTAVPLGQQYGQQSVLTNHGMVDLTKQTLAPLRFKRIEMRDMPKDVPQTVVMTQPAHVTIIVDTGQPVPFGGA